MAGVAEMLLQSHEGYIEPLAALPEAWKSGKYSGLVARGNFEISTIWKNRKVVSLEIISKKGGECRVRYSNISHAVLKDYSGNIIPYDIESLDVIRFNTNKNDVFFITFSDK